VRIKLVRPLIGLSVAPIAIAALPSAAVPAATAATKTTRFAVGGVLAGVTSASAMNAWAVGYAGTRTLILHWNGRRWT
jgi:hypothetical protein